MEIKKEKIYTKNSTNLTKTIKCFCNDDVDCPKVAGEEYFEIDPLDIQKNIELNKNLDVAKLIGNSNKKLRYCITNSVCLTKKYKRHPDDPNLYLKYSCSVLSSNSIRESIIQYRDCRIKTTNQHDSNIAKEHYEYCCDDADFCNLNLYPKKFVYAPDYQKGNNDKSSNMNRVQSNNNGNNRHFKISLDPIQQCLIIGLLAAFLVCLIFLIFKLAKKLLNKNNKSKCSTTSKTMLTTSSSSSSSPSSSSSKSNSPNSTSKLKQHHHHHFTLLASSGGASGIASAMTTTTNTSVTSKESSFQSDSPISKQLLYQKSATGLIGQSEVDSELIEPFLPSNNNNQKLVNNFDNVLPVVKTIQPNIDINFDRTKQLITNQSISLSSESNDLGNFHHHHNHHDHPGMIKINSPLSLTQSSSFVSSSNQNNSSSNNVQTTTNSNPSTEFEWSGSGSGAGFPQCVQRTIARQIKLFYPCIGKGRFGEVYKGEWRGEYVAVKTFNSADEKSWENECNIYNTNGFRHENILGFIAADNIDRGTYTELWLITEFHENGSLYDYLNINTVQPFEALKMALSIVNGLVHLHMPIESCQGKPALAHCDLKSKNILVKSDLTCCISDLGLALSGDKDGRLIPNKDGQIRTGTKRYMAPEILSKRIDIRYLDAFQKAEMYSLGLVFWELLRRCKFDDPETNKSISFEYKPPYYECIAGDPDEQTMKQIVCDQKIRPQMNLQWKKNKMMAELANLTEELWVEMPNERLNPLRLKKSLVKIKTNFMSNRLQTINDSK